MLLLILKGIGTLEEKKTWKTKFTENNKFNNNTGSQLFLHSVNSKNKQMFFVVPEGQNFGERPHVISC